MKLEVKQLCIPILILAFGLAGCNSIRTTPLDRAENGALTPNPQKPLKGVPVMLPVPTHIDVEIVQVDYWVPSEKNGELKLITNNGMEFENRHVRTDLVKTPQMFLVDPKRPGAGQGIYKFNFFDIDADDADQTRQGQLESIGYKSQDDTLKESFALYGQIRTLLGVATDGEGDDKTALNGGGDDRDAPAAAYVSTTRTIAFRRFKLNRPGVDQEVQSFVQTYLNNCSPGCTTNQY